MNPESIIKGRIAETIVGLIFEDAGYSVFRYGHENMPQSLIQYCLPKIGKGLPATERILTTPTFIIIGNKNQTTFIKIKFQKDVKSGGNIKWGIEKLAYYWPETNLIIVRSKPPYFLIGNVMDLFHGKKIMPLKESASFIIGEDIIKKYELLVRRFLT